MPRHVHVLLNNLGWLGWSWNHGSSPTLSILGSSRDGVSFPNQLPWWSQLPYASPPPPIWVSRTSHVWGSSWAGVSQHWIIPGWSQLPSPLSGVSRDSPLPRIVPGWIPPSVEPAIPPTCLSIPGFPSIPGRYNFQDGVSYLATMIAHWHRIAGYSDKVGVAELLCYLHVV